MKTGTADLDFCGITNLIRVLVRQGHCTEREAKKIAKRIAGQLDVSITFSL